MPRLPLLTIAVAGVVLLAACGDDDTSTGDASGDTRTVEIDMVDIAFEPDTLEVSRGKTVRFVFINSGDVAHDAFIGDIGREGVPKPLAPDLMETVTQFREILRPAIGLQDCVVQRRMEFTKPFDIWIYALNVVNEVVQRCEC